MCIIFPTILEDGITIQFAFVKLRDNLLVIQYLKTNFNSSFITDSGCCMCVVPLKLELTNFVELVQRASSIIWILHVP